MPDRIVTDMNGRKYVIYEPPSPEGAAEREKVAKWMLERGYATGHGDTVEDLLKELEWQVAEREREACAEVCEAQRNAVVKSHPARIEFDPENFMVQKCAAAIRARGD